MSITLNMLRKRKDMGALTRVRRGADGIGIQSSGILGKILSAISEAIRVLPPRSKDHGSLSRASVNVPVMGMRDQPSGVLARIMSAIRGSI